MTGCHNISNNLCGVAIAHSMRMIVVPITTSGTIHTCIRDSITSRNVSNQSSKAWLDRQHKDPYVQKAHNLGLPSRAYFKLEEINEKLFYSAMSKRAKKTMSYRRLIHPNMLILDLGAAPGGWSMYASTQLNHLAGGAIVSVDLLELNEDVTAKIQDEMDERFEFIQGDFTHDKIRLQIMDAFERLSGKADTCCKTFDQQKANIIISDMAANFTGDSITDAIRTINLCEQSLVFSAGSNCFDATYSPKENRGMLRKNGSILCKYFLCGKENERDLMEAAKRVFRSVHLLKPQSSRKDSSEMYLLGFDKQ